MNINLWEYVNYDVELLTYDNLKYVGFVSDYSEQWDNELGFDMIELMVLKQVEELDETTNEMIVKDVYEPIDFTDAEIQTIKIIKQDK